MIIVSQDKKKIINFARITEITVSGTGILVGDNVFIPKGEEVGKYKTEERAKEVLKEIWKFYEILKRYECSSNNFITIFLEQKFAYQMPEE